MRLDDLDDLGQLTEPERRLWRAFPRGGEVDLRPDSGDPAESAVDGHGWGPERTVRAQVVRALLLGAADGETGHVSAVRLAGARITGRLSLQYSRLDAPLLILGFLVAMRGLGKFFSASLIVMLVSGVGVWLTSDPRSVTVGASGLIFGYFGYLLARGIFDRQPLDIAIGVVVFFLYNGMLFGVLPGQPGISWQGHLFGFVGGIVAAWMLGASRTRAW